MYWPNSCKKKADVFAHMAAWLEDSWTVTQKELKERLAATLADRKLLAALITLVVGGGVLVPWLAGGEDFGQTLLLVLAILAPVPLVIHSAADSFAGERERRTLETLLASRLPIQAILVGKIMAASLYGWLGAWVTLIAGIMTISVGNSHLAHLLYSPALILLSLTLSFLVSLFTACMGAYISLRTSSIHQAQLSTGLLLGLIFFVTALLTAVLLQLLPGPALVEVESERLAIALAGLAAGLLIADLGLYIATSLRFKRRLLMAE